MRVKKKIVNGIFLSDDSKDWVILRYEKVKILVSLDLERVIYFKPVTTQKELIEVCRILNDSRLSDFDSQAFISLILEKYRSESLIYEKNQGI